MGRAHVGRLSGDHRIRLTIRHSRHTKASDEHILLSGVDNDPSQPLADPQLVADAEGERRVADLSDCESNRGFLGPGRRWSARQKCDKRERGENGSDHEQNSRRMSLYETTSMSSSTSATPVPRMYCRVRAEKGLPFTDSAT